MYVEKEKDMNRRLFMLRCINVILIILGILLFLLGGLLGFYMSYVDHNAIQQKCLSELGLSDYVIVGNPVPNSAGRYSVASWIVNIRNDAHPFAALRYDRDGACVVQGVKWPNKRGWIAMNAILQP